MKKILIVSVSFHPENSPRSLRTTELVKEFARQEHQVTLITPIEKADSGSEEELGIILKDLGTRKFKDIDIIKGKKYVILIKRLFRRGLLQLFQYPVIEWMFRVKGALKNETGYDLMISIASPHPVHWGVAWARTKKNRIAKTWVADCGDPFMLDKSDSFKKLFYFGFFEKLWNKKCDYISVPFEGAVNGYYKEFHDKIRVIPQGFSFPEIDKEVHYNKIPTFLYSGSVGSYKHYFIPFFDLLKRTNRNFKLIIFTKEAHIFNNELSLIKDKLEIHNYVPREVLLKSMAQVDFLIHFPYQNEQQKSLKLIDYHYSKKPILSYRGTEDNKIFNEFLEKNYSNKLIEEDTTEYKIQNVCQQFLNLI